MTTRAVKATRGDQPFGWICETEMRQAEHPLAVVGRAIQVLHSIALGVDGESDMQRVFDGLGGAIIELAKSKQYDTLGWLLYGLEASVNPKYREGWPLSETGELRVEEEESTDLREQAV